MTVSAPLHESHAAPRPLGMVQAGMAGVANQVVTSGTNFLLGIFMLRALPFAEFGRYGTLYSLCLIASGLVIAFFLEQMTVLFPDHERDAQSFPGAVLTMLLLLGFCLCGLALALLAVPTLRPIAAALAFTAAFGLKEFFVRAAYALRREPAALRLNAVMAAALFALLSGALVVEAPLSAPLILALYALCCLLAALCGGLDLKIPLVNKWPALRSVWSALLLRGKWGVSAELLYLLRQQAHVILTALLVGPTGVALINAARLFVTPVMVMTPALSQVFMARLVRLRASPRFLLRRGLGFSIVMTSMVCLYGLVFMLAAAPLTRLIGPAPLPDLAPMVLAWLCVAATSAIISGLEATQKALQRFRALLVLGVPAALMSVATCVLLLHVHGPVGAVLSLVLTQVFFIAILLEMTRRLYFQSSV
jgi:O-antigen/teichoic acid export membrane protein